MREVAACPHAIHVRDSKTPTGPIVAASPEAWSAFTAYAARQGTASHPTVSGCTYSHFHGDTSQPAALAGG